VSGSSVCRTLGEKVGEGTGDGVGLLHSQHDLQSTAKVVPPSEELVAELVLVEPSRKAPVRGHVCVVEEKGWREVKIIIPGLETRAIPIAV